ncbi:uncharacterized protein LOC142784979 [Rhipicephalus microplus]|uniref:uncharacterized protein LOC142784979 n=1 Tax=Rhipicephalus microplus TaxID=6941 RepID=UPI003F6BF3FB
MHRPNWLRFFVTQLVVLSWQPFPVRIERQPVGVLQDAGVPHPGPADTLNSDYSFHEDGRDGCMPAQTVCAESSARQAHLWCSSCFPGSLSRFGSRGSPSVFYRMPAFRTPDLQIRSTVTTVSTRMAVMAACLHKQSAQNHLRGRLIFGARRAFLAAFPGSDREAARRCSTGCRRSAPRTCRYAQQ